MHTAYMINSTGRLRPGQHHRYRIGSSGTGSLGHAQEGRHRDGRAY